MQSMEIINQKIEKLWEENFQFDDKALFPLFYPSLKKHSLLFIGCNPSFNEIGFRKIFKGTENESLNTQDFYLWKNRSEEKIKKAAEIEIGAKAKHNYFNQFREISKYVGLEWEHIDLFLFRETKQKNIENAIYKNKSLNEFGKQQVEIAREIISMIEPKIIVIANAFASKIIQSKFHCVFNENLGCHFILVNDNNTPIFFTSMLTGQRALDTGSMMRLKWHIKQVLAYTE